MLTVNTTSKHPTHFLRGVDLVYQGMEQYNIPSENWPYPTEYKIGTPQLDRYYAEVWVNGMDWQPTYWIIEEENLNDPKIYPFIRFEEHSDKLAFNDYDFEQLVNSCFWFRRNSVWIKNDESNSVYNDMVWPFLFVEPRTHFENIIIMSKAKFEHASQVEVEFEINHTYVPERCKSEEHWNYRNEKKKLVGGIQEGPGEIL